MKLRIRKTSHQKAGEKSKYKWSTKKATERMLEIKGQFVVYQHCTSYSLRYSMLDSHPACTEYNLPTRRGFGQTRHVTITSWCTGCWSNVVASGVYRCTSARSTSQKHSTVSNTLHYGSSLQVLRCQASLRETTTTALQPARGDSLWRIKKAIVFPIKRGTKQGDPTVLFTVQHSVAILIGRRSETMAGETKRHQAERCNWGLPDEPEICRWCIALLHVAWKATWNAKRVSKSAQKPLGLGIHPDKTKILSNQDKIKAKEIAVDNIKIEILGKESQREIPWAEDHVRRTGNRGNQKQTESSVGSVPQISPGIDVERLPPLPQTSPVQHVNNTDDDIRQWYVDTDAVKHEKMIKTAQRKMLRLNVQTKRKYKPKKVTNVQKRRGHRRNVNEEDKEDTTDKGNGGGLRAKLETKTRTAMYLSWRKPMKKSMPLKMKKIGSNTSKGALKKSEEYMEKAKW